MVRKLALILILTAAPFAAAAQDGGVSDPVIPKAKGEKCVADTGYMRRFHMKELMHQRDETMHEGIRTQRFSLKECIACHATEDGRGQPVPINAPGQFCESCHEYAAVEIDCFQCHATTPGTEERQAQIPGPFPTVAATEQAGRP